MAKVIKRNIDAGLAIVIGLFLLFVSIIGVNKLIEIKQVDAATTDTAGITVSATVAQTISINVSSSALDLGTLAVGSVSVTSTNFTVKTNAANGYTVTIEGYGDGSTGGLYGTTTSYLVTSTATTLSAGTEGYGAQGTSTNPAKLKIYSAYDYVGTDQVGALATTPANFASSSSPTTGDTGGLYLKAAISSVTPADTYNDYITLTATGSF